MVSAGRVSHIWLNGALTTAERPRISARDRGFTLGDGLFETIWVRAGRPVALDRHFARLHQGLDLLQITLPWDDRALAAALETTVRANALPEAAVRLTVSRGTPEARGLVFTPGAPPTVVIDAHPWSGYPAALYSAGMRAIVSKVRRNERSPLCRIKSLSYLDNVLARQEATEAGADEALLLNSAGALTGASAANLFLVLEDRLVTPSCASGALPGTTRAVICDELAPALDWSVSEAALPAAALDRASEAFLTSALMGVMPLNAPGPRTRRLMEAWAVWSAR